MAVSGSTTLPDMSEACTFADAADLRELDAAAAGLFPEAIAMVLAGEDLVGFEAIPKARVPVLCSSLQACSRSFPPMPLTSELDQQR